MKKIIEHYCNLLLLPRQVKFTSDADMASLSRARQEAEKWRKYDWPTYLRRGGHRVH